MDPTRPYEILTILGNRHGCWATHTEAQTRAHEHPGARVVRLAMRINEHGAVLVETFEVDNEGRPTTLIDSVAQVRSGDPRYC